MKDLNEISVFTRVAQLGSFSKAAKALNMPVSTVSRKVSDLETRLGISLIQRTTRKLNLTQSGVQYFQQCADLLQGLDEAEIQVTQTQTKLEGFLRISIPVGMASGKFIDFISDFVKRHPRIELDLLVTNEFVDLVADNVDVALRFGELDDSNLIARHLGTSTSILVASPEYLKKHGTPKHPQDLKNHQVLLYKGRNPESVWEMTKDKSKQKVRVKGQITATDLIALRELAIRGHGVARLPDLYRLDAIEDGRLKHVLSDWSFPSSPGHAVYVSRRFMPARLEVFLKELENWESPSWRTRKNLE